MSTLSQAYLNLTIDASASEIEAVRTYLAEVGRCIAIEVYGQEIEIEIRIEDGSLKAWVTVVGLIWVGVASYGSFRTGIDYLVHDGRQFGEMVTSRFIEDAGLQDDKVYRVERRLGIPGRIRRLLVKIEKIENAEYTNPVVRTELEKLRQEVQRIVDDLDTDKDRKIFVSNLPEPYQDVLPTAPKLPELPRHTVPMLRPTVPSDYVSDGTLAEFSDKYGHRLRITHEN